MPAFDTSPHRRVGTEDPIRSRRGHVGLALFSFGFRPFFLFGAIWGALATPLWVWSYLTGRAMIGGAPALDWHVHEMLFGFIGAVIAGFLLTAVPNWTGRMPVRGMPLMGLSGLWLAGRAAMLAYTTLGPAAAVIDAAFLVVLAAVLMREVITGRNLRNLPVCILSGLFALANIGFHFAMTTGVGWRPAQTGAIAVITLLIALIGGRIVPSFTRNWLVQSGQGGPLPAPMGRFDTATLVCAGSALLAWVLAPQSWSSGMLLIAAGGLQIIRLARWKGWRTGAEPLVLILHAGYAWLALSLVLMGLAALAPGLVPATAALHALTAGAMGTMTLAVMTRASLGHTGRERTADVWTRLIYGLVITGAIGRVLSPLLAGDWQYPLVGVAAVLWSGAFGLFALRYGPMLVRARQST
ncbi:NnrS family protein [Maricaulis sp. CAU 1757]